MGPGGDDRGANIRRLVARWDPDGPSHKVGAKGEGPAAASSDTDHATFKAYVVSLQGQDLPKPRIGTRQSRHEDALVIATPFEGDSSVNELEGLLQPAVVEFFSGLNHDDMSDELIVFLDSKTQELARSAAVAIGTWDYSNQDGQTRSERASDRIPLDMRNDLEATLLDRCPENIRAEVARYAGRIARACSDAFERGLGDSRTTIHKPLPAEFDKKHK